MFFFVGKNFPPASVIASEAKQSQDRHVADAHRDDKMVAKRVPEFLELAKTTNVLNSWVLCPM